MYEPKKTPLISRRQFAVRLVKSFLVASAMVLFALLIGVFGYHEFAELPWIDAILNASMILAGMGSVDRLTTSSAKLFASAYALFSGIVFLSTIAFALTPVVHRFFHKFHLEENS